MTDCGKELLLSSLTSFYSKNNNYLLLLRDIIDGKFPLSLRMIDWLVTIYAKNNNMVYWICIEDEKIYYSLPEDKESSLYKKINLYLDYRSQLKSFKKINFDSFRRHDRITFMIDDKGLSIETTIGQLNFFKWAFSNRVIFYAIENQKNIYDNMSKISYKKINKKNLLKQDILNARCFVSFN